jgi:DNA-binding LacI/PurR family transcriptional regulator
VRREKTVTLKDVAERSGVAISTASRALSRPGRVNPVTAERVRAAARELGYTPTMSGRALRLGRTGMVALVVPDVSNQFFMGVVRGVQARLRAGEYMHVLVDTEESVEAEERALRNLRTSVDGFVLASPRLDEARLAAWSRRVPLVVLNRTAPRPAVVVDTPSGVVQGLEHLVSLGHRRIAYAGGPRTSWSDAHRRAALRSAARKLRVEVVALGPYLPQRTSGAAAADAVLASGVTAVLAFNDLIAFGILDRLAERGVEVPGEVSVVGCDDVFGADLVRPALTTVHSPHERAGFHAADLLLTRLDPMRGDEELASVLLPTHLVTRGTSGPAPRPSRRVV